MSSYDTNTTPDDGFTLVGGILNGIGFANADFEDASFTRPEGVELEALGGSRDPIQGIVNQTLRRHLTEAIPATPNPFLESATGNWRKRLREMIIRQNETVLAFLTKPVADHSIVGPVEKILQHYAIREDIDVQSIKSFKQLVSDISGAAQIQKEIDECIQTKGPSSHAELCLQVNALLDLYKQTGNMLLQCESQMKSRLEKMDKLQKRVTSLTELQTNEATPELLESLEKYLKIAFHDMSIESMYKDLLFLYQKHIALREAITFFKTGNQLVNEPLCPICITEHVSFAIVPCGHTFCSTCSRRMSMECGVCRGKIRERMKLYFS